MSARDRRPPDAQSSGVPPVDSGGVPFAGRTLTPSPFAGDDGSADPALAAALAAVPTDVAVVHAALMDARVFVPVLAVAGDDGVDGSGAEKSADMALPVLRAPDGRETMPIFSSAATLSAWETGARPVPALARRVALVAVQEERQMLVLDVAGPATVVLPRPALWALARGEGWTPAPRDPEVTAVVRAAVTSVEGVLSADTAPGQRAELRVVLTVVRDLDRSRLRTMTDAVTAALAAEQVVADRVDSLELELVAAEAVS